MYCKKCKAQIDDNANFCSNCGEKLNKNAIEEAETKDGCFLTAMKFTIILSLTFVIAAIIFHITKNKFSNNQNNNYDDDEINNQLEQIVTREANNNDVIIRIEQNITYIDVYIKPQVDIDDLEIEVELLDKNSKHLMSYNRSAGNVVKGVEVKIRLDLTKMPGLDYFKIYQMQTNVTSGKVSILD